MKEAISSLFRFGEKEKKDDSTPEQIKLTGDIARVCLGMKEFRSYREAYEKLESAIIEDMIGDAAAFPADNTDISKFGAKCLVKLTRLRDLRALLSKVTTDVKRGQNDAGQRA